MDTAVGCSVGTGWVVMVSLRASVAGGSPEVVDRRRVELAPRHEAFVYHLAAEREPAEAEELVARVLKTADDAVAAAVDELRTTLGKPAGAAVIGPEPPWDWPPLAEIVRSHPMLHTAEGHLFREAVWDALAPGGFEVRGIPRRGLVEATAAAVGVDARTLQQRVDAMGKPLGPPWRKEQKEAALAAWHLLAVAAP